VVVGRFLYFADNGVATEESMDRGEWVDDWFEEGWPGANSFAEGEEVRLHQALRAVITAMPEEDFDRFNAANPTIVCKPHVNGAVFSYAVFAPAGMPHGRVNVLYLSGSLFRMGDRQLTDVVAHECAHIVLGHHAIILTDNPRACEVEADGLSASWGFRRTYSKRKLDQIAAAVSGAPGWIRGGKF
jgi:hypothetical protein